MTKFNNVKITTSDLTESRFLTNSLKSTIINDTKLTKSNIINTSLNKIDLSTDTIDGISIDPKDLSGAIINYNQAAQIVTILGIEIR